MGRGFLRGLVAGGVIGALLANLSAKTDVSRHGMHLVANNDGGVKRLRAKARKVAKHVSEGISDLWEK